jgi:mono/diheme cytochrome c family protein
MKSRLLISVLVLVVGSLFAVACSADASSPTQTSASGGDAARGEANFQMVCKACHGDNGKGIAGLGKDLTTSEFVKTQTDEQLAQFLLKGRSSSDPANTTGIDMPPKGGNPAFTEQDIRDIVLFLRSINR